MTQPQHTPIPGLVVSRREGEVLLIEHPEFGAMTITVEESRRGTASLRVDADKAWKITRLDAGRPSRHQRRQQRPHRKVVA